MNILKIKISTLLVCLSIVTAFSQTIENNPIPIGKPTYEKLKWKLLKATPKTTSFFLPGESPEDFQRPDIKLNSSEFGILPIHSVRDKITFFGEKIKFKFDKDHDYLLVLNLGKSDRTYKVKRVRKFKQLYRIRKQTKSYVGDIEKKSILVSQTWSNLEISLIEKEKNNEVTQHPLIVLRITDDELKVSPLTIPVVKFLKKESPKKSGKNKKKSKKK